MASSLLISQQLPQNNEFSNASSVAAQTDTANSGQVVWLSGTIVLFVMLVALFAYGKSRLQKVEKKLNFERYKTQDLTKKLQLALVTIRKMETNPDLVHAREFNLDYLRMRMDEGVFHGVIVNQIKINVTQLVGEALRPDAAKSAIGIMGSVRQINSTFDVTYDIQNNQGKWAKGVLFRIRIKLKKLPTQASTTTISQICECLEYFLSPTIQPDNWQPVIQKQLVDLSWDQKAKPTPLLVVEQLDQGVSVFSRSKKSS